MAAWPLNCQLAGLFAGLVAAMWLAAQLSGESDAEAAGAVQRDGLDWPRLPQGRLGSDFLGP